MNRAERLAFVRRFLPGLALMIGCYVALTVVRDFRDNFEAELFADLGYGNHAGVFALIETPVALAVLALTAGLTWFRDNLRGLKETVIVGRLIPAGTGLAYHSQRRKNASGLTDSEMEALAGPVSVAVEAPAPAAVETVAGDDAE